MIILISHYLGWLSLAFVVGRSKKHLQNKNNQFVEDVLSGSCPAGKELRAWVVYGCSLLKTCSLLTESII